MSASGTRGMSVDVWTYGKSPGFWEQVAQGSENVLYPMKEALRARATVGEVCNALRDVWGVYSPPDAF